MTATNLPDTSLALAYRDLIVPDAATAWSLTADGIAAADYGMILRLGDIATMTRLAGTGTALIVVPSSSHADRARAVAARLGRLGLPFRLARRMLP